MGIYLLQTCKFNCSCPAIYIHIPTVFVFYESKLSFSAYHLWHMDVHWTLCAELKIISTLKNKVSVHSLFNCVASQQKKKKKKSTFSSIGSLFPSFLNHLGTTLLQISFLNCMSEVPGCPRLTILFSLFNNSTAFSFLIRLK